jgi:hypothetical protein
MLIRLKDVYNNNMIIIAPLTIHLCLFNIKLQKKQNIRDKIYQRIFVQKKGPKFEYFAYIHTTKAKRGKLVRNRR